ncbi:Cilia- and flagella-associated protein 251 [Rhizophlyctis rosea]|nr:Cilia- and flagella-associated protein 251 [Rhizophlyctis rosea]
MESSICYEGIKCNLIRSTAVSPTRRFLLTADTGPGSMVIIWDTDPGKTEDEDSQSSAEGHGGNNPPVASAPGFTKGALPIKTIFDPHQGHGVVAADFSPDTRWFFTLGNEPMQTLAIWDWTSESDVPTISVIVDGPPQIWLKVNPRDSSELITNGKDNVNFFTWAEDSGIQQYPPILNAKDFKHTPTAFNTSIFIPTEEGQALSATADGDVILWTDRSLNNLSVKMDRGRKAATKFLRLHNTGINVIKYVHDKYLITGGEDGFVKIYDLQVSYHFR